jgi:hypothetical protein
MRQISRMRRTDRLVRLAISALGLVALAVAQTDRGAITGTVSDPAKAVIPGAAVVAVNSETGAQYETVTTETGNYTLPSLPAGLYNLSVSAPGFTRYVQQGIRVQVVQTARIDVVLQVGSTSESITVNADAPLLRTEGAEQSANLSTDQVNALPNYTTNLRTPLAFAMLMPGVTGSTSSPAGSANIRVNGSPATTYRVLVDGQDITSTLFDASHTLEQQPAVEALQEFTLQASNFAAEFGQVVGGLFNYTTKSGTNSFHGSAFFYFRNEFLDAGRPFTDNGQGEHIRPLSRRKNWGFAVGGPVLIPKLYNGRDKTFFFGNLEVYQNNSATDTYRTLPTKKMRTGDFSEALTGRTLGTDPLGRAILENMIYDPQTARLVGAQIVRDPFAANAFPASRIDPVAGKIQDMLPLPTRDGVLLNWRQAFDNPETRDIPSIKVDHNLGYKSKFSFYWSRYRYATLARKDGLPIPITSTRDRTIRAHTFRLNYDFSATPTLLIHSGVGYVRHIHDDGFLKEVINYDPLKGIGLAGNYTPGMPSFGGLSSSSGGGVAMAYNLGMGKFTRQYNDKPTAVLSATLIRGNHSYKAGVQWRNDPLIFKDATGAPSYSFSANQTAQPYLQTTSISGGSIGLPYASFLLGMVNSASVSAMAAPHSRKNSTGLYVQDTWKVTPRITLDYGLRWDYQEAPHEVNYRNGMFGPTIPNPSAGGRPGGMVYEGYGPGRCNCRFTDTYPYAVGPRLGIAYRINPRTVLRAGYAIQYGNTPDGGESTALGVGWNTINFSSVSFGEPAAVLRTGLIYDVGELYRVSLDPGLRPSPGQINSPPYYQDRNGGRPPRINQWNIAIQRELTQNLVVEAAYVGNRGVWLQGNSLIDFNAVTAERLKSFGLDINNAADRALLRSRVDSSTAKARGFGTLPYTGFPSTLTVAQSLRPYPQFGSIPVHYAPLGNNWYDSLQVKVNKRYSHGLVVTGALTWAKALTLGAEDFSGGGVINDVFNRPKQKALSGSNLPIVFVSSFTYRVPGLGPNRVVRTLLGDWTVSGVLQYSSGALIQVPSAQNNLSQLLFRGTLANRVPGQPLWTVDPNGPIDPNKTFVLNPAAWSDPADGQWGYSAPYYSDYRARRRPNEQLSLGRIFRLREGMTLEIRAEYFNAFNRLVLPNPSSGNALATQVRNAQGIPTSGFGFIQTAGGVGGQRNGQLLPRFQF